jgi:hypothetical protein
MWEIAYGASNVIGGKVAKHATGHEDIGRHDAVIAVGARSIGHGGRDVRQACCQCVLSSLLNVLRISQPKAASQAVRPKIEAARLACKHRGPSTPSLRVRRAARRAGSVEIFGAAFVGLVAPHLAEEPGLACACDSCVLFGSPAESVGSPLVGRSAFTPTLGTAAGKFVVRVDGHLGPQLAHGGENLPDVGRHQRVIRDPGIAHNALPIQDED